MIYVFIPDEDKWASRRCYFKSDKNTRELTTLFNNLKRKHIDIYPRRVNDDEYGVYYYDTRRYIDNTEEYLKLFDYEFTIVSRDEFFNKCKELNTKVEPTNEKDIREAVQKYLDSVYNIHFIQDEYTHTSLPVRADVFAITKDRKIITVEIKSDRDTFTRLRKQLEEYTKFSHKVYLAIDIKHLPKFLKNYPNYYGGILVYEDGELEVYRKTFSNKEVDVTNLLWKQELIQFCTYFNGSFSKYNISELENIIKNTFTVSEYYKISENLFTGRYLDDKIDFLELIDELEYKQKKVDKITKRK